MYVYVYNRYMKKQKDEDDDEDEEMEPRGFLIATKTGPGSKRVTYLQNWISAVAKYRREAFSTVSPRIRLIEIRNHYRSQSQ